MKKLCKNQVISRCLMILVAVFCCMQTALAYDFSAVSPSGHTIYYNIVEGGYQIPRVSVTYPNTSESPWGNIQRPYGNLVLPETVTYNGTTYNVAYIGSKAFQGCAGLVSVVIPSCVITIEYNSFSGCESLTTVTINSASIAAGPYNSSYNLKNIFGNQVTSYTIGAVSTIGSCAFYGCTNLASVTLHHAILAIDNNAFYGCSNMYRVNITDLTAWLRINFVSEYSNPLCYAHNLYLNGTKITELTIPSGVSTIKKHAFRGCSMTSVDIPSNITSIKESAFQGCTYLTSVSIPNSVTSIDENAFRECSNLPSVFIPSSISVINAGVFRECTNLTSVNLPYLSEIGDYAFYNCRNLTELFIPDELTRIGSYAFYGCSSATSLTIPSSVSSIGQHAFDACPQMTSVTINSNSFASASYAYNNNFEHIFGDYARSFTFGSGVTSIGTYAFYGCNHMTSVTLPSSLTSIGYSAFEHCLGLNWVKISDMNAWYAIDFANAFANPLYYADHFYVNNNEVVGLTVNSNISEIKDYAFVGYKGLHSVSIGYYVTSIGNSAFENCSGLTSVTIGNSVSTIGDDAFKDCTNLTSVTLNNSAIASADYTSSNNLKSIFGNQVTSYTFGAIVASIGDYAFYGSTGLTSVTIPNTLYTIGENAFYGCTGIISVTFAGTPLSIGNQAFGGCNGLTRVNISDLPGWCGIIFNGSASNPLSNAHHLYLNNTEITHLNIPSSVTSIGNYAFYSCKGLTSLTIHDGVTSIGAGAFIGCTGLTGMHVDASEPPTAYSATFNNVPTAIPIYVPIGSVPSYKAATGWSRFTNYKGVASPDDLIATVPYEQSFYQNFIPSKWTSYEGQLIWDGSINKYTANLSTNVDHWFFGYVNGTFLSSHAWASIGLAVHAFWLVSPIMHLDGEYNMLSFDMALTQASGFLTPVTPGAQNNTRIFALVSTDHGLTWTKLEAWRHNTSTYSEIESLTPHGATFAYNLENYADQDIMVGFYVDCSNANDAYNRVHIDNFFVGEFDPSTPPTVAVDDITGYTATVSWTPAFAWQQGWDFYYKSEYDGLEPYYASLENLQATGRFHHLTETSYALQNLTANTFYQVWVRHRDGSETGSWSSPLGFTTTSQCAPPKNPQVVTTQTTATLTWEPGQPNQNSWYIYVYGYHDAEGEELGDPSFTMTDLTPGSEFQAQISGSCTGGDGGSESIWVEFSTDDYDRLTVNEGNETNENVVIMGDYCCMSNPMSQTQFVIPADMLTDMQYSTIKKLSFYSESDSEEWDDASFQIFITEVNTSDFVNKCEANTVDFVNWNYMTQFYNGTLTIEHHVMTITPSFGGGFYYTNGNLVVGIRQNQTGDCHQGLEWHGVNTNTTQALYNTQLAGVQCEEFLPKVTFAYEPDPYKPPTEFIAYAQGSNEVFFWWEQVDGAISYDIEVSWSPDFDEAEDQLLSDLPDYFFVWDDYEYLEPNSSYYARIRSHFVVNGTDHFSSWSEGVEFTTLSPCPAPTNLTVEVIDNLTVELDWTENGDATEWGIAYAAAGENELGFATYHHPYVLGAPYLEPGKTYTVRVRPICEGEVFAWSNTVTFNTNNIVFEDQNVKALCVANWDTSGDGELSFAEAAEVTTLGEVFRNKTNITSFDELQFFTGLTTINNNAFYNCSQLRSVVVPNGVTTLESYAFQLCTSLISVTLPTTLTEIKSNAFRNCSALTSIEFPEGLTTIREYAFYGCTSLFSIFIPASVTTLTNNPFAKTNLSYIYVDPANTVFDSRDDCNAIINKTYNQLVVGCKNTVIPSTALRIWDYAFRECVGLTSIYIPENIKYIYAYAFYNCSELTSVNIPSQVTKIYLCSFYGCSGLSSITIPSGVTEIEQSAFKGCTGLTEITVLASTPPTLGPTVFAGVDNAIPVYVPCDYMTDYYDINGTGTWGGFTNFIAIDCPQQSQVIALHQGWNWWAPKGEMSFADLGDILDLGRGLIVLSQDDGFARYEDDLWQGTLSEFVPGKMYKIKVNEDCTIVVTVAPVTSTSVTIAPGFNWMGYTGPAGLSIATALGSFVPNEGDEIHDEDGIRMASYDGENWEGNLSQLVPGKGYLYYSTATESKTLTFE